MVIERKKKILLIGIAVATLIGFVAIIIAAINYQNEKEEIVDDFAGEEIYENSAVFGNRASLNAAVGPETASIILNNISNFIFTEDEMNSAQYENTANYVESNYYDVKINDDLIAYDTNYEYKVTFSVSDGRKYELTFITDEKYGYEEFIIMSIKNLFTDSSVIYLNTSTDDWKKLEKEIRKLSGLQGSEEVKINTNPLVDK